MAYRVEISPTAHREADLFEIADVEDIYFWIYEDSPEQAAKWLSQIYEAMNSLSTFPLRCGFAPENDAVSAGIRQLIWKKFRVLYSVVRLTEDEGIVQIHRLRRLAQKRLTTKQEIFGGDDGDDDEIS